MHCKYNQLLKLTPKLLKTHLINIRSNVTTQSTQTTFKYSANINNKDCIRLAFIYGMCGTFASYLSMNYDGKVLVFKWSVPTPERFVFCTWCWAIGGMASWMFFWTKPDALIRAASSKIRYGFFHGTQTTSLALTLSFATIGSWSMYFDIKEWQIQVGEWRQSLNNINNINDINKNNPNSTKLMTDITNTLIKEETNDDNDDNNNTGVTIINNKMKIDENINKENDINKLNKLKDNKPALTYQIVGNNIYEPCKLFFMSNAAIWLICGSFTGMIAARVLTNAVSLSVASGLTTIHIHNYNKNNLQLLDC